MIKESLRPGLWGFGCRMGCKRLGWVNIITQLGKLDSLSDKARNAVNYARFGQQGANLAAIFERSIASGRWSEIQSNDDSRYSFISRSAQ